MQTATKMNVTMSTDTVPYIFRHQFLDKVMLFTTFIVSFALTIL